MSTTEVNGGTSVCALLYITSKRTTFTVLWTAFGGVLEIQKSANLGIVETDNF